MAGENKSRISSVLNSLFPPRNSMSYNYKYLKKAPFLLPFSWCQMWCKRLFVKKDVNFKTGLKNRLSYTDEDVKHYKSLLDEMNLKGYGLKLDK